MTAFRRTLIRFGADPLSWAALIYVVLLVGVAVLGERITPYAVDQMDLLSAFNGPSPAHWFGADEVGRDVLTRILVGARVSLVVGLGAAALAVTLGTLAGAVAGYLGGVVDAVLMRLVDGLLSVPLFFLLLVVLSVFGSTLFNIVLVIGLTSWMGTARVVRSEVLRTRELEFITATRALGARESRVLFRHVLPAVLPLVVVAAGISIADAIMLEAALSFLGLGIQPPEPSWGTMLTNAQMYIWSTPLLALWPGLAIVASVLSFTWLTEGVQRVLAGYAEG